MVLFTPSDPWLAQVVTDLGVLTARTDAVLRASAAGALREDLVALHALLGCVLSLLDDPIVQTALAPARPDPDAEFDSIPHGGQAGPQTDAQRSRIYGLAHALAWHPKHLIHWLSQHWPPAVCVEELSFGQSEAAIQLLERRQQNTLRRVE